MRIFLNLQTFLWYLKSYWGKPFPEFLISFKYLELLAIANAYRYAKMRRFCLCIVLDYKVGVLEVVYCCGSCKRDRCNVLINKGN